MITNERLEELIKEGATIYTGNSDVHLQSSWHFVCYGKLYENHRYESEYLYDLEELFETEEEADKYYMEQCIDKDHRIAVLERALELLCEKHAGFSVPMYSTEYLKRYYIYQAEKELEEKK